MRDFYAEPVQRARLRVQPMAAKEGDRLPLRLTFFDGAQPVDLGPSEETRAVTVRVCRNEGGGPALEATKALGEDEGAGGVVLVDVDLADLSGRYCVEATVTVGDDVSVTFPARGYAPLHVSERLGGAQE